MKKKRGPWVFAGIVLILIIAGFLGIQSLTNTGYGRLNTKVAIMLKFRRYFAPASIKGDKINQIRDATNLGLTIWSSKPIPFTDIKNITISTPSAQIPVRIYTPKSGSNFPIVIFSHGGAWVGGSLDTHETVCRKISKYTNAIVVSVGYRLAPENPFPAGLNDVYEVLDWAYRNADTINGNSNEIAVVGDSAGGNFSTVVSMMSRDKGGPRITCQVLVYPSTNIFELNSMSWSYFANGLNISREEMENYISLYIPKKEDRKNPYASPLFSKDLNGLPPALVITAELDPLRDEGEAYAKKLKDAGIDVVNTRYKGVTHGFINMDHISIEGDKALIQISLYLQKQFQKHD
jgi:acetyl esterase